MPKEQTGSKTAPITEQTSNAAINGFAKRIRASYGKSDGLVHEGGVLALSHFGDYGDCTGMARIYDAMPKSTRRSLFSLWAKRYGGVIIEVKAGKTNAHKAKEGSAAYKAKPDIEGAKANPWHSMPEVENEPTVYDLNDLLKMVDQLGGRIKRMVDGESKKGSIIAADVERAKRLATMLTMLKVPEGEATANNDGETGDNTVAQLPVTIAA